MASRVTINVNARDLTRGPLARIRNSFQRMNRDITRFSGNQNQNNFNRLNQSLDRMGGNLQRLRGQIPDDEFQRMTQRVQDAQRSLNNFGRDPRGVAAVRQQMRDLAGDLDGLSSRRRPIRIQIDERNTRRVLDRTRRTIGGFFGGILRSMGNTFQQGIGDAIGRGFQAASSHPAVGAAILAAAVALASMLGAAIAGVLTLAFGAAFVGLGAMFAIQSESIKKNWKDATKSMGDAMRDAAKPLIPVINEAIDMLDKLVADFAPHFKEAMEEAAPHLTDFLGNLDEGFREFGKRAFKPMMEAFNELMDVFGPHLKEFFASLGDSFAFLAQAVKDNKDEIALAMRIILEHIPAAIRLIGALAYAFGAVVGAIGWVIEKAQELWGWLERNWSRNVIFNAPGIGGIIGFVSTLFGWVDRNWFRSVIFNAPGIGGIIRFVASLFNWVDRDWFRSVRFTAPGIQTAIRWVSTLWSFVNRNWSRTISMNIAGNAARLLGLAHGGVAGSRANMGGGKGGRKIGAAATGGVRGNMTMVGEHGPEIVNLPSGSHVRSNPDSRRMLAKAGRQQAAAGQIVFRSSGRRVDDMLIEILREAIHQRGGDPMIVLGG